MADQDKKAPAGAAAPPASATPGAVDGVTRRQVLRTGMFMTIGGFFAASTGSVGAMFWPINLKGFGAPVPVPKKLSEIKVGDPPVMVRDGKYYLTRTEEGLWALYWKCVHLGCTVPWSDAEKRFHCPCHGSVYDLTGTRVAGPAPRPLDIMEISVNGEDIIVNTGKITQRNAYDPTQAFKVK